MNNRFLSIIEQHLLCYFEDHRDVFTAPSLSAQSAACLPKHLQIAEQIHNQASTLFVAPFLSAHSSMTTTRPLSPSHTASAFISKSFPENERFQNG